MNGFFNAFECRLKKIFYDQNNTPIGLADKQPNLSVSVYQFFDTFSN